MEELGITVQVGEELITVDECLQPLKAAVCGASLHMGLRRPPAPRQSAGALGASGIVEQLPLSPAANARIIAALLDRLGARRWPQHEWRQPVDEIMQCIFLCP